MNIAKKGWAFGLILALVLCTGIPVMAEDSDLATTGEAGFVNNPALPPIVNPLEPESELDIEQSGTASPLNLDYVPDLNFGDHKITSKKMIYYASSLTVRNVDKDNEESAEIKVPNFIQITDNRGTGAGWSLSVSASAFQTEPGGKVLTGAEITFSNPQVYTPNSSSDEPVASGPVVIPAAEGGGSSPVLEAGEGAGKATWGVYFAGTQDERTGDTSVALMIPGQAVKLAETYTATLTWNLVEAPYS